MATLTTRVVSGLRGLTTGLWVTLKNNFFRKRVTIQYGYAPRWSKQQTRPIAPRYRGRFVLIREPETGELRCVGCKMCAQACPGRCIEVAAENKKVSLYTLDMSKCLFCGLCVEACPFEALGMSSTPEGVYCRQEELVLTLEKLAQTAGDPMPGVMPSTMGGDLRPGKKPFVPKTEKKAEKAEKTDA